MVFVMKPAQHRYRNHSAVRGNAVSTGSLSDTIRQPIWNAGPEAGVRAGVIVQRYSSTCGAGGPSAGTDPWRPREYSFVSLAAALSWALSNADGGVRFYAR